MRFDQMKSKVLGCEAYDSLTTYTPAYEVFYREYAIAAPSDKNNGWVYPALFQTADHWVMLSESGIDGNYAGTHLAHEAPNGRYSIQWPDEGEAEGMYEQLPSGALPWSTSWKTISLSTDLQGIVASDVVKRLAAPNKIADTDWIRPGSASWSWLSDHDSPQDYQRMIPFIDNAADMGWPYFLVDANWDLMKNGNVEGIIEYAQSKGVDILMWYNSGGDHNQVTERPRDIMDDPKLRKEEFAKLREWGVKGVKVDFFQSDKQAMMQHYRDILVDAAAEEILVNFHGCTVPRGWSRTYPNLMTMESVRGGECYSFAPTYNEYAHVANTILPFTRNVVGPMDYTPVLFTEMFSPQQTSYGHELALSVVFESGLQHFADAARGYQELPAVPQDFLRAVPTVWDEIKLLQGFPGKEVVIARRHGRDWFIGGINGEDEKKIWEIDLSFLSEGQTLEVIGDGATRTEFATRRTFPDERVLVVDVLPKGGFAARTTTE
ncbi:MAG: glycoside hydrolase family 97 catalytic domain-containing protein [Bacteroidota bacterium]